MTLILSQNHVRLVVVSFYLLLSNTIELIDVIEVMILSSCHHHDEVVQLFAHHFEKEKKNLKIGEKKIKKSRRRNDNLKKKL